MSSRKALLSSVSSLSAAGLTTLAMILASRRGLFVDIASYSSGAATTAIAAVIFGGGTTLNYITGSDAARAAVARIRLTFVLPSLLAATLLGTLLTALSGHLSLIGVFLGGLFVTFNNLSELASADLQRKLRTKAILAGTILGRALTVLVVALGERFSVGAALGAVVTCLTLFIFAHSDQPQRESRGSFTQDLKGAYTGRTVSLALADAAHMKAPFLAAPMVLREGQAAGQYSTLLSAQQSLVTVVLAPLYSAMANASASGRQVWARRLEGGALLLAIAGSGLAIVLGPWLMGLLGIPAGRGSWWTLFMLAIPVTVLNRTRQYQLMAASRVGQASRLMTTTATVCVLWCTVAKSTSVVPLAAAPLAGEIAGTVFLLITSIKAPRKDGIEDGQSDGPAPH